MKNVYVVLGMARSGTSAIARGLKALGIDLGSRLIAGDQAWNAKGFFEDTEIVYSINRSVLAALHYSWQSATNIKKECEDSTALEELKTAATHLLSKRMADAEDWGFKDPRTSLIVPFWQTIFQRLNLNEHYVISLRNPLASAYSYQKVTGVDIEEGLLLWMMHLIPAIECTRGKKRVLVSYHAMLENPRAQLERIHRTLAISLPLDNKKIDEYANEFLDKNLQHHEYSVNDLQSHSAAAVAPLCLQFYLMLSKVAKDEIDLNSEAFESEWQSLKNEFAKLQPIYCYIDTLLKRNKELVRANRTIRKSIPWKFIYPLRLIDDLLRAFRRQTKKMRKLAKIYE